MASGPVHPHPGLHRNKRTTAGLLVTWYHGVCSSAGEGFNTQWRVLEADAQNSNFSNS